MNWHHRLIVICITLVFSLLAAPALAFVDSPVFTPAQPTSQQAVTANVRNGVCHALDITSPGSPPLRIERVGQTIQIIVAGATHLSGFCNVPVTTDDFNLGVLPVGQYSVEVWMVDAFYSYQQTFLMSSAPLTVTAAAPETIPASRPFLLMAFASLMALLATWALRRRGSTLILAVILLLPLAARAEDRRLLVLLSDAPGTPTPQMVVEPISFSSGYLGQLSSGFQAEDPIRAYYLLTRRAYGSFKLWLLTNPEDPRAKLERYVIIEYPEGANLDNALVAMAADSHILAAFTYEDLNWSPLPVGQDTPAAPVQPPTRTGSPGQGWITDHRFDRAWLWAGGWSLVATIDNGLQIDHPDLRSFDANGNYLAGNFLTAYGVDVGRVTDTDPYAIDFNVDEREPVSSLDPSLASCDTDGDGWVVDLYAGHGTHVAGLIGASHANSDDTKGACMHCGISPWRVSFLYCDDDKVRSSTSGTAIVAALTYASDVGVQVANQSFGGAISQLDLCAGQPNYPWCLAMQHAEQRGMLMVAASGNDRRKLNFPALDVRVAAVGGLEPDKTIWNDRLDLPTAMLRGECPDRVAAYLERQGDECGSNFTGTIPGERRQEVVFAARNIYSTIYTGQNWNPYLQCGDSYGDTDAGNGRGECSGTSMSAPLYSGLAGILRSINPLVMPGNPESTVDALGIRDAIIENAAVPGGLTTWDPKYGYGIPNAEGAVQTMLGAVAGRTIKNRLTPLFNLYGATATDWAQVTVPQAAIALLINEEGAYASQGATVSAYPAFPGGTSMAPPLPAPKAAMYVLTTEYQPNASTPPLLPLYWLDRARPTPLG